MDFLLNKISVGTTRLYEMESTTWRTSYCLELADTAKQELYFFKDTISEGETRDHPVVLGLDSVLKTS